ncbi:MAG: nitrite reductase/ring-hydroxylating ferredoxin subunit [Parvicellaceae bacterium]|jgi:nitrite reductase/ring-hydroxylating ferredoxin subunit
MIIICLTRLTFRLDLMFKPKIKWHRIGDYDDIYHQISDKKPKHFDVMGHDVVLCKKEDGILVAMKDKCPHHGKKLSDGWCEDNRIVCPYHQFSFDLDTGMGCGTGVDTYELEKRDQELFIGITKVSFF